MLHTALFDVMRWVHLPLRQRELPSTLVLWIGYAALQQEPDLGFQLGVVLSLAGE